MPVFETVRQSFEAKKEAYEASAGVVACLVLAALFGLGAFAIWLASFLGPILSAVCLAAAFLIMAGILQLVSQSKHEEAGQKLEVAEKQVGDAAHVVTSTITSAASIPTKTYVWLPVLLGAAVLLIVVERRRSDLSGSLPDELMY